MINLSQITQYVEDLLVNTWWQAFLALIAIVSLIGMIYLHYRVKKEKLPYYSLKNATVIEGLDKKYEHLKITYKNEVIGAYSITKFTFLNGGRDTINRDDVLDNDPLRFVVGKGEKILDMKIITSIGKSNNFDFDISDDLSSATFSFDYLDKGQGFIAQVIHTATDKKNIKILGYIKGVGAPRFKKMPTDIPAYSFRIPRIVSLSMSYRHSRMLSSAFYLAFGVFFIFVAMINPREPLERFDYFIILIVEAIMLYGFYDAVRSILPKGFDEFYKELED